MRRTLVVPIDFTPVSHEALLYACELSVGNEIDIVAVHILDTKLISQFNADKDEEVRKMAEHLYKDMLQKTKNDLDNFLEGLAAFYGDIIHPLIAQGTIFEAFNQVAATYNAPLIVMGTHGIVGMQHIFGSKAYKVILNSPYPFLVVQERSYNKISLMYLVIKSKKQLYTYTNEICNFAAIFKGEFVINIMATDESMYVELPSAIATFSQRCRFIEHNYGEMDIVESAKHEGADAIGIIIDEEDNQSDTRYGMTQDKILINKYKFPVFCLPVKID